MSDLEFPTSLDRLSLYRNLPIYPASSEWVNPHHLMVGLIRGVGRAVGFTVEKLALIYRQRLQDTGHQGKD